MNGANILRVGLPVVSLGLSVLALGIQVIARRDAAGRLSRAAFDVAALQSQLDSMALERPSGGAEALEHPEDSSAPVGVDEVFDGGQGGKEVEILSRLDGVERKLLEYSIARSRGERAEEDKRALSLLGAPLVESAILDYQTAFVDAGIDINARIAALKMLARFPPEANAFDPIVDDAVEMLAGALDDDTKSNVLSLMDDCRDDRLLRQCMSMVADAESEGLRLELVRYLAKWSDQPDVHGVLQDLAGLEGLSPRMRNAVDLALTGKRRTPRRANNY